MLNFGHKWITASLPRRHDRDAECARGDTAAAKNEPCKGERRKRHSRRSNTMPNYLLHDLELGKKWCYLYWSGNDERVK